MKSGPRISLRRRLTGLLVLATLLALGISSLALVLVTSYYGRLSSERELAILARVLADNSTAALSFGDESTAQRTLAAVQAKPDISLACLHLAGSKPDRTAVTAFAVWPESHGGECPQALQPSSARSLFDRSIRVQQPVLLDGERLGTLSMSQNLVPQRAAMFQQVAVTQVVVGLALTLTFLVILRMQTAMVTPVTELAELARKVSVTGDYGLRARVQSNDEVGQLVEDFNGMLGKIKTGDAELRAARDALSAEVSHKTATNQELELALSRLTETQSQLVQSEKLASLGALVAGVAHEINTPVGVAVTAASTLQARALLLKRKHEEASMKRSDLEAFVSLADESTRILLNNLQRAAELIQSFKRVAVDQSSDERRSFDLATYLNEVLLSLGPKLKNVEVRFDCDPAIRLDSYPGALAQIVTNFVTNSIVHGFDDGRRGRIAISARADGGQLLLSYQDNGKGMDAEHLPRIFDPFFTTKRGSGGSGLGMHIVYNLINQRLGGRIVAESSEGQGLRLKLSLPLVAPVANPNPVLPSP